jgi:ureidoglycolate hydrolase
MATDILKKANMFGQAQGTTYNYHDLDLIIIFITQDKEIINMLDFYSGSHYMS